MRKAIIGAVGGVAALLTLATAVSANGYDYYSYSDPASAAAAAGTVGTFAIASILLPCCFVLGYLILDIVLAVLVYKDATKNKVENGAMWAVLTFFFNVIGLLVYYLAIKPEAVKKNMAMPAPEHKHEAPAETK